MTDNDREARKSRVWEKRRNSLRELFLAGKYTPPSEQQPRREIADMEAWYESQGRSAPLSEGEMRERFNGSTMEIEYGPEDIEGIMADTEREIEASGETRLSGMRGESVTITADVSYMLEIIVGLSDTLVEAYEKEIKKLAREDEQRVGLINSYEEQTKKYTDKIIIREENKAAAILEAEDGERYLALAKPVIEQLQNTVRKAREILTEDQLLRMALEQYANRGNKRVAKEDLDALAQIDLRDVKPGMSITIASETRTGLEVLESCYFFIRNLYESRVLL